METFSIVVLASSYKNGERCIAGKRVVKKDQNTWTYSHNWVRPVTTNVATHGAIPAQFYWRTKGSELKPMDIITVGFDEHAPEDGQPENRKIDETQNWVYEGRYKTDVVNRLIDTPDDIWVDATTSIDKVSQAYTASGKVDQSLYLIEAANIEFELTNDFNPFDGRNKRKMTVRFDYNGVNYSSIRVTDPLILNKFGSQYPPEDDPAVLLRLENGDDYRLCISLAPPFGANNTQSKLLAAVIPASD